MIILEAGIWLFALEVDLSGFIQARLFSQKAEISKLRSLDIIPNF